MSSDTGAGNFIEIPVSQNISVGETAVFRCQHSTADAIRWKLNGEDVDYNNLPPGIIPSDVREGSRVVYTLNIVGSSEYDGAVVIGVAKFFDGSSPEETHPAAILHG